MELSTDYAKRFNAIAINAHNRTISIGKFLKDIESRDIDTIAIMYMERNIRLNRSIGIYRTLTTSLEKELENPRGCVDEIEKILAIQEFAVECLDYNREYQNKLMAFLIPDDADILPQR
jgi:hypothetical protein